MPEIEPMAGSPANRPVQTQTTKPRQKGRSWFWVLVALVLLGIGVLFYYRGQKPPARPPPPLTISTTNAVKGDIAVTVSALGTVTPVYTVGISPRVDGQIIKVQYNEGQMVKTNDLLLEIDPEPYKAVVIQAEGQLARDKAQLEGANIDLKRYEAAYEKKAIPQQQVADQQALVHQYQGTVRYDEGQLTNAQVQLNYCSIRAPISGRVGLRPVDPGNVVHAANSNALVVIAQLQPITVVFSIAEDYVPEIQRQLQAGQKMTVEAYDRAWEHKLATGTFLTTDNLIDASTATIRIKSNFKNDDLSLFPNQFVNAKLIIEVLHDQTLVPTSAIQRNPDSAFLYVVTDNQTNKTVVMRSITIGATDQIVTAVKGVNPGEIIATDNFNKLGQGTKVALRTANGEGETNAPPRKSRGGGE